MSFRNALNGELDALSGRSTGNNVASTVLHETCGANYSGVYSLSCWPSPLSPSRQVAYGQAGPERLQVAQSPGLSQREPGLSATGAAASGGCQPRERFLPPRPLESWQYGFFSFAPRRKTPSFLIVLFGQFEADSHARCARGVAAELPTTILP